MQDLNYPGTEPDLLSEFTVNLEMASHGKRFVNYLIDVIVYYAIIFVVLFIFPSLRYTLLFVSVMGRYAILVGIFLGYYCAMETLTKGKTLGKMVTGTRAVDLEGNPITARAALLRSLCRLVPFEPFSAFGRPWHDTWTQTMVIDEKKSILGGNA